MKNKLLIAMIMIGSNMTKAQSSTGFEQYVYADREGLKGVIPVIYYQTENNWYFESHFNYERLHAFSVYIGKTFSENREFSYSFTPMIGGVAGSLKGGVAGLNSAMNYKKLFFSSQSQYVFSFESKNVDFLYSWMELGYQVIGNVLVGLSIQHTLINPANVKLETGLFIRYSVKKWSFPLYCFNATKEERYLILGIAKEFSFSRNKARTILLTE
jgi:hypothetical protein